MGADQRVSEAVLKARRIVFEGNSQYRTPYSRELEGEFFDLIFDDGSEMIVSFPFRNRVSWTWEGRSYSETGHVMKAEDGAFYVMTEVAGSEPRQGLMLLLDVAERLVTGIFLQMGAVKERPNLVTREVKFGAIKDGDRPLPAKRHEYTKDLVGKKIIVVANLKPAVLCGIESNGMILASGEDTVRVVFLDPETPLGERVR